MAALVGGLACATIMPSLLTLTVARSAGEALELIVVKSLLFGIPYLVAVILLHQGFDPLLQVAGLLRDIVPGANNTKRTLAVAATGGADMAGQSPLR